MPRLLPVLLGALLLVAPGLAQKAVIQLDAKEWQFGDKLQGEIEKKTVVVKNLGDANLVIKKVGVTCGCVGATIDARTIAPGASTQLHLSVNTGRVSGKIHKYVYIESNADGKSKVMFPVRGTVQPLWWLSTRNLNFGVVEEGATPELTFRVHVLAGHEIPLARVQTTSGHLETRFEPFGEIDGEHGYVIHVRLGPKLPTAMFVGAVQVRMLCKIHELDQLTVSARVQGPVRIAPDRVSFGAIPSGQGKTVSIMVECTDGTSLEIKKIVCTDKQISYAVREIDAGKKYRVDVTIKPVRKVRRAAGRFYIMTNHPKQRMIPVGYRASIIP